MSWGLPLHHPLPLVRIDRMLGQPRPVGTKPTAEGLLQGIHCSPIDVTVYGETP